MSEPLNEPAAPGATQTATAPGALLDKLALDNNLARNPSQVAVAREILRAFVWRVLADAEPAQAPAVAEPAPAAAEPDLGAMIAASIASIDEQIQAQLNAVLHHDTFQDVEAVWRGLHYLVFKTETGPTLKIRVLNTSRGDLLKDLSKAVDVDQSVLFKRVYEDEYGTFGGNPFSMLMASYEFGRSDDDVTLLEKIAEVASAAHTPFIAAAHHDLFDLESYTRLDVPRDLSKIFESLELARWRDFRSSENSRYVSLVLPRMLLRKPYNKGDLLVEGTQFQEEVGQNHDNFLWGSAAFALTQRITDAFAQYGWTAAIRGVRGGGLVEGLPLHTFSTDEGDIAQKCPTEIAITDRREKELSDLGFITLVHRKGATDAAFFGGQTTHKPTVYFTDTANSNSAISARLPYLLNASRFAHYIKVNMRDRIGSFMTKENVEVYLNSWIMNYVLGKDDAGQELKAKYPLREARVDVFDVPGRPGSYTATVFLRPHFQLEELTASIRLVAQLPPPAAA
jgi:type VI secretion system protein ImpC